MPSLSAKIVYAILKIKGIKKIFSQDPIWYEKLRKDDQFQPPKSLLKGVAARSFNLKKSTITELLPIKTAPSDFLLIFCPGGAFVSGPNATAWPSLITLVKQTGITGWMVNYPKAPEHQLPEVAANIDAIYAQALEKYPSDRIILIGDSVGGQMILTLTQRLLAQGLPVPKHLIAVCPMMDLSVDHPKIADIDPLDPMLSRVGVHSANQMAVGEGNLKDATVSPLFGSFKGFPATTLFLGEHDIFYPDGVLGAEKMKAAGVEVGVIIGKEMIHVWPYMPVMKEAKEALEQIAAVIKAEITR